MQLSALLDHVRATRVGATSLVDGPIARVVYDARLAGPGDLFVAVPGTRVDGHDFLAQAAAAGAPAALVSRAWADAHPAEAPMPCFAVSDTRHAMAEAAAALNGHPSRRVKLLAVTGTNGKTTTTHLVASLLEGLGVPTGTLGTLGAHYRDRTWGTGFTTPQSPELQGLLAEMAAAGAGAIAMEASSHAIDQSRIYACAIDTAVFTNVSRDHLDYHGTMEAYAAVKQRLFTAEATGAAPRHGVVNLDDALGAAFAAAAACPVITYGLDAERHPMLLATDLSTSAAGCRFTLAWQGERFPVTLPLPGRFNVSNALAALGTAMGLGHEPHALVPLLANLPGVPGRAEVVSPPGHPFTVWVDYAHTPDGLDNVLSAARALSPRRLIAVFGCGGDRDRTKRPLMGAAVSRLADHSVITSDNPRSEEPEAIVAEIVPGMSGDYTIELEREAAIAAALRAAGPGDLVVIAGKGHETTQTFKDRVIHFDDREVARQVLAALQPAREP